MTYQTHRSLSTGPANCPIPARGTGRLTEDIYSTIFSLIDAAGQPAPFSRPLFSMGRGDVDPTGGTQGLPETSLDSGGIIPAPFTVTGWYARVYGAPPAGGSDIAPAFGWAAGHVVTVRQGGLVRVLGSIQDALRAPTPLNATAAGLPFAPGNGACCDGRRLTTPIQLQAGQLTGELAAPAQSAPTLLTTAGGVLAVQVGLVGVWR